MGSQQGVGKACLGPGSSSSVDKLECLIPGTRLSSSAMSHAGAGIRTLPEPRLQTPQGWTHAALGASSWALSATEGGWPSSLFHVYSMGNGFPQVGVDRAWAQSWYSMKQVLRPPSPKMASLPAKYAAMGLASGWRAAAVTLGEVCMVSGHVRHVFLTLLSYSAHQTRKKTVLHRKTGMWIPRGHLL